MSDDYLEKLYAESVLKGRTYVNDPSEAPDDVDVQQGPRGGYYYEDGAGGSADDPSGGGGDSDSEGGVTGYTGELPWGEKPQRVAAGIASDVAQEAQEGGAYEYRDDVEVADIAEESAREYARENDLDEELFVDEVREQVRMNLEDAAEYGNNQERGQSDSGSDSEEEEDGSDDDDDGMVEIRVLGGEDDEAETIEAPREVNGWEYEQGALGGTIVWQGESDDRWVSWSKTSSNAWMAQLKTEDDRVNRTARDPELALTYAKRLMQENDPDAGDGAE